MTEDKTKGMVLGSTVTIGIIDGLLVELKYPDGTYLLSRLNKLGQRVEYTFSPYNGIHIKRVYLTPETTVKEEKLEVKVEKEKSIVKATLSKPKTEVEKVIKKAPPEYKRGVTRDMKAQTKATNDIIRKLTELPPVEPINPPEPSITIPKSNVIPFKFKPEEEEVKIKRTRTSKPKTSTTDTSSITKVISEYGDLSLIALDDINKTLIQKNNDAWELPVLAIETLESSMVKGIKSIEDTITLSIDYLDQSLVKTLKVTSEDKLQQLIDETRYFNRNTLITQDNTIDKVAKAISDLSYDLKFALKDINNQGSKVIERQIIVKKMEDSDLVKSIRILIDKSNGKNKKEDWALARWLDKRITSIFGKSKEDKNEEDIQKTENNKLLKDLTKKLNNNSNSKSQGGNPQTFQTQLDGAFNYVIGGIFGYLASKVGDLAKFSWRFISNSAVGEFVKNLAHVPSAIFDLTKKKIIEVAPRMLGSAKGLLSNTIEGVIRFIPEVIAGMSKLIPTALKELLPRLGPRLIGVFAGPRGVLIAHAVVSIVEGVYDAVKSFMKGDSFKEVLYSFGGGVLDGLTLGLFDKSNLKAWVKNATDFINKYKIPEFIDGVVTWVGDVLKETLLGMVTAIPGGAGLIKLLNNASDTTNIKNVNTTNNITNVRGFNPVNNGTRLAQNTEMSRQREVNNNTINMITNAPTSNISNTQTTVSRSNVRNQDPSIGSFHYIGVF